MKLCAVSALTILMGSAFANEGEVAWLWKEKEKPPELQKENVQVEAPESNPSHLKSGGFFVTADYLLWQAHEEGLIYALDNSIQQVPGVAPAFTNSVSKVKVHDVGGDWSSGVRVGLGYHEKKHDGWDAYLNWTYFYNHSADSVYLDDAFNSSAAQGLLFHAINSPWLGEFASSASATWKLRYNIVDIELGRDYFASRRLTLRPFIGVRGADIRQKFDVKYGHFNWFNHPYAGLFNFFEIKNDFYGAGIRAGVNTVWYFSSHWGLCGDLSASLVYGKFNLKEKGNSFPLGLDFPVSDRSIQTIKWDFHSLQANIELGLGLLWETCLRNSQRRLSFALMYEFVEWFHQNQFFQTRGNLQDSAAIAIDTHRGNLNMQGVTLKGRFDF